MEKYDDDQLEIDFRNNEDIRDILFKANERRLQIERDAGTIFLFLVSNRKLKNTKTDYFVSKAKVLKDTSNYDRIRTKTEMPEFPTSSPEREDAGSNWKSALEPPVISAVDEEEDRPIRRRRRERKPKNRTSRQRRTRRVQVRPKKTTITRESNKPKRDVVVQVHIPRVASIGTSTLPVDNHREKSPVNRVVVPKRMQAMKKKKKVKTVVSRRRKKKKKKTRKKKVNRLSAQDRKSLVDEMGRLTGFLLRSMKEKRAEKIKRREMNRQRLLESRTLRNSSFRSKSPEPPTPASSSSSSSSSRLSTPKSVESSVVASPVHTFLPDVRKQFSDMVEKIESMGPATAPPSRWDDMVEAIERLEPSDEMQSSEARNQPADLFFISLCVRRWYDKNVLTRSEIRLPLDLKRVLEFLIEKKVEIEEEEEDLSFEYASTPTRKRQQHIETQRIMAELEAERHARIEMEMKTREEMFRLREEAERQRTSIISQSNARMRT